MQNTRKSVHCAARERIKMKKDPRHVKIVCREHGVKIKLWMPWTDVKIAPLVPTRLRREPQAYKRAQIVHRVSTVPLKEQSAWM